MIYTVYILKCSDQSYYVGVTNNIESRLVEHNSGLNRKAYTYSRRPVALVYTEHFGAISDAIAFEKQIKGWRREKKEALIAGDFERLPELSRNYYLKNGQ